MRGVVRYRAGSEIVPATDRELLRSYVSTGSAEAFGELVERYSRAVHSACLRVLGEGAAAEDPRVHEHKIRIRAIGDLDLLPDRVKEAIRYAEDVTKDFDQYSFNLAVAYGGREEILNAIRHLAQDACDGKLDIDGIDEKTVTQYLYTSDLPDPDLILRTSGEERISNFLLWQLAYSELYFTDVYWPGFRKVDFLRALRAYQQRKRRYGH